MPAAAQLTMIRGAARAAKLHVATYSPGDGITRYRFFRELSDYFEGNELGTALGPREAMVWLGGYAEGIRVRHT